LYDTLAHLILPAVRLWTISPPRGGEYLHEVTAGSMSPMTANRTPAVPMPRVDAANTAPATVTSDIATARTPGAVVWSIPRSYLLLSVPAPV